MAFDQNTRNRLQRFVSDARGLLADEFTRQLQNDYGMDPSTGEVSDLDTLSYLDDTRRKNARLLRNTLKHYLAATPSGDAKEVLYRIIREQAFTVLNRLCALRMAEAREILVESVGKGTLSTGFQMYAVLAGTSQGETGAAYRHYLFSLFDEFAQDLAVLFDRYSPLGRLFPKDSALMDLLEMINDDELVSLWAEDETIGWIYQHFNSVEERKQMRSESKAPRNSRELAVRNQFFTPRYVVEFLTDNTLGRIWYEMTRGETALKEQCRYLVRRPHEIFLVKDDDAPEEESHESLSQEALLKQPVYIPHRPLKDPREIRMLDPACGSMHFGLYAFDLFEQIYTEAWELQSTGQWPKDDGRQLGNTTQQGRLLVENYTSKEDFLRDIPRLIIEHNIHGVDIDPRAAQIAGLSLWLRAQRSWKEQNITLNTRPQIRKSNIVCAESMPGEKVILKEFTENLKPKVLGQLVEIIFDKMELAGEAGSLLKIEEEIEGAIESAREAYNKEMRQHKENKQLSILPDEEPPVQTSIFDFTDLQDKTEFWHTAEQQILDTLQNYSEQAETGRAFQRRLFADDTAKGFAFIDLCQKRFDVVLMNPPFGEAPESVAKLAEKNLKGWSKNILCAFIIRSREYLLPNGLTGAIFDRTAAIKSSYEDFRRTHIIPYIFTAINAIETAVFNEY